MLGAIDTDVFALLRLYCVSLTLYVFIRLYVFIFALLSVLYVLVLISRVLT